MTILNIGDLVNSVLEIKQFYDSLKKKKKLVMFFIIKLSIIIIMVCIIISKCKLGINEKEV